MGAFWREKAQKGIAFYHEHGLGAFLIKSVCSIGHMIFGKILYFYYRISCMFRLKLDEWRLLHRVKPYEGMPEIILSLTSFPARIKTVHKAVETLLVQTYQPDRIILWLADDEFPSREQELPKELLRLCSKGLEIRWCKNTRSYKKLIPALELFPKAAIITVDDDVLCNKYLVERLVAGYIKRPDCIQCHRAAIMIFHAADHIERVLDIKKGYVAPTYLAELTGCCGCLYPPNCFHEDITKQELYMSLAPTNDDLWFWLMGAMKGYRVNIVEHSISKLVYIPNTQEVGLCHINNEGEKLLFVQLKNILKYYPELMSLLQEEQYLMNNLPQ